MQPLATALDGCDVIVRLPPRRVSRLARWRGRRGLVREEVRLHVPVPPVRVVLTLFAIAVRIDEQPSLRADLVELCRTWLPEALLQHLFHPAETDATIVAALLRFAATGTPREGDDETATLPLTAAAALPYEALFADIRDAFGIDARAALELPWPYFLRLVAEVPRATARRHSREIRMAILPHTSEASDIAGTIADEADIDMAALLPPPDPEVQRLYREAQAALLAISHGPPDDRARNAATYRRLCGELRTRGATIPTLD